MENEDSAVEEIADLPENVQEEIIRSIESEQEKIEDISDEF